MAIQMLIERGLLLVQHDANHDLRLGFRCGVLKSLVEHNGMAQGMRHKRSVKLETMAVEKVLPLWDALFPSDRTPYRALQAVQLLGAGSMSSEEAAKLIDELSSHCDDLTWRHPEQQAVVAVALAAVQAAIEASTKEYGDCAKLNEDSTDLDVDPHGHDAAFFAAVAYSVGPPWDAKSDAQKRLEFWIWWLTSAIGAAISVT